MTGQARRVAGLAGKDALSFLQGLVSNDVLPLAKGPGLVWAALLTPQGKYLADFFVVNSGERLLLDLPESLATTTLQRLGMYRLRADVTFEPLEMTVARGLGEVPAGGFADPRHPALGWRAYGLAQPEGEPDWQAIRVEHVIPESGIELVPNETYLLEAGFERLHGVDFRKGCYVGQEVTARMKHKTEVRKGLARVKISAQVPVGTPILTQDGKEAGVVYTQSGDRAIAWLRFDRADAPMTAGPAQVSLAP